ncbi:translocation and assembly module lipoprotein TamL [Apibacter raozihei]|uniref:translocation and assembly module lipoprotein TamL n=1 Tax=Apibacter raozihei TaxID=2500547 RepID=UPI000FE2C5CB
MIKLKRNITLKILISAQILLIFSCKTNKVPEKQYLFIGNKYNYLDKKGMPYLDAYGMPFYDEKGKPVVNEYKSPFSDELDSYVKQKPNKTILFFVPLALWMYDRSDPKFDSVYYDYYKVKQKERNQALLDSLYIKYNLKSYVGQNRWFDRFFYNNGEPPVIADTAIAASSAKNLQQYFKNRGWRKSSVKDTLLASGKKAKVRYDIKLGRPMIMDTIIYDVAQELQDNLYNGYLQRQTKIKVKKNSVERTKEELINVFFSRGSSIKKGDRLDAYVIEKEISRIENRFQNMGYFRFNDLKDEVIYYVDTAKNIYNVPVRMSIKKSAIATDVKKDSAQLKFKKYKYNQLRVTLQNLNKEMQYHIDSTYYVTDRKIVKWEDGKKRKGIIKDTIAFIVNETGGRYKNRVLGDMLAIEKGQYYRLNSEIETRRNIYKVNNFNILGFKTAPESGSDSTLVTNIILTPMDKYSYEIGFEAFGSKVVNFGITPNVTFTAKNLFKGAENLSVTLGGSVGNIESKKNNSSLFNASEVSAQASLSFPKLLVPFNGKKIIPKRWGPSSAITLGYNAQYNIGLDRRNYNAGLSYNFTPTRTTVHQVTLWGLQYTQFLNPGNYYNIYTEDWNTMKELYFKVYPELESALNDKKITEKQLQEQVINDRAFRDELMHVSPESMDSYGLLESRRYRFTQNVLISSFKYNFTYDQRLSFFPPKNPFYIKTQIELAGNALSIFNKSLKDFTTSNDKVVKEIFGVPYSQFVKIDLDIRKYWNLSLKKSFNVRFFTGIGIPYGNSFDMPFDRSYSVGGPSDVRAFKAFGFGPGTSKFGSKDGYELVALENFKLLTSLEYRFPLPSKGFEGALFVDAGNVWGIRKNSLNKFEFDSFYKELGIGGGWGVRWNISNFIIRFDFAYKFHDPRRDEGDRWYFKHINVLKPQINFAIDYPF